MNQLEIYYPSELYDSVQNKLSTIEDDYDFSGMYPRLERMENVLQQSNQKDTKSSVRCLEKNISKHLQPRL